MVSNNNVEFDEVFSRINELVEEYHHELVKPAVKEEYATVHIIGVPRSGTTLATQLLSTALDVAYPSNASAVFWRAPLFGVILHKKLFSEAYTSSFNSHYGLTMSAQEPHEYGRFWFELFGLTDMVEKRDQKVDWDHVKNVITQMTHMMNKAYVFKSFIPIFYLSEISKTFEKSIFVHVKRDRMENALSLLKARHEYSDNPMDWVGLKPLECQLYESASIYQQIASQIVFIEKKINQCLYSIPNDRKLCYAYPDICISPNEFAEEVAERIGRHQLSGNLHRAVIAPLQARERVTSLNSEHIYNFERSFAYFDEKYDI